MGYILVLILGVVVLAVVVMAFMGGKKRPVGRASSGADITHKTPAANEPTPGASNVASNPEASAADKHVPPA